MAIAGLHNVSVLSSSFLRETRSQASRQRDNDGRASARASSLLQMWRELEDDHVVRHAQERVSERLPQERSEEMISNLSTVDVSDSHDSEHSGVLDDVSMGENEFGQWSPTPSRVGSQSSTEGPVSFHCEYSSDLGEVERERVRQIFREWMNCGKRERTSTVTHVSSSRAEWLGETEQERVRIIREWVQMNSQQGSACGDTTEEQSAEANGRIERVLDGMIVNQNGGRTEQIRRGIRKLCGRQALLDMLKKNERERQRELQALSEHHAVSSFAHRNRIQSLLRGRFLRNERMVEDGRPTSSAANELGLLRQRHTVSGLREELISRLDHSVCGRTGSNHSDTLSIADTYNSRNEQQLASNLPEMNCGNGQSARNNGESGSIRLSDSGSNPEHDIAQCMSWQETTARVEEWQGQVSETVVRQWQQSTSTEFSEMSDGAGQSLDGQWQENIIANESSQETSRNEAGDYDHLEGEIFYEQPQRRSEESSIPRLIHVPENLEGRLVENLNPLETFSQGEQQEAQVLETEETDLQRPGSESNAQRDGTGEDMDDNLLESTASESFQGFFGNEDREQDLVPEASEVQHDDDGLQNWLEEPFYQATFPVERTATYYLPEDDNVHSVELRELLSRRRVSNLLRSGFRESLDRLIQSYVERQNNATMDWELHETSLTATSDQDLEQPRGNQSEGQGDDVESRPHPLGVPSPPMLPVQPLWDQEPQHANWPPNDLHQRFGIEWEIINDLRIDMARLQQRMNNMQRMLEACMDMQLELQRSIRQEVSAALNRSSGSPGLSEDNLLKDGSKWDCVRKGICCVCCDNNIDSLLYRCGHMCTCSKCANELVQGGGKCPMCHAPVIEVIRAYSIL